VTILITGGTGTTGGALARLLRERGEPIRIASRHPVEHDPSHVHFDLTDPATFPAALAGVRQLYLLPPTVRADQLATIQPFLAAVKAAGVRRIVLLSSAIDGVPGQDAVHKAVADTAPEWAILRPSWFMQNFIGAHPTAAAIRERGEIANATGTGKLGFIDAEDIAAVAAEVLLMDSAPNAEYLLTGPETLSYADAAALISEVAGYPVRFVPITRQQSIDRWLAAGIPEAMAAYATEVDLAIANGSQDWLSPAVLEVTGRPPRSLREFLAAHRSVWQTTETAAS
jgi:uncharacterized protein YbjT (DUF2867 family)